MGFIKLLASLGAGAILTWVIFQTMYPLLDNANDHTNPGDAGAAANDWLRIAIENLPFIFLILAFFGFIILAVYQREAPLR